MKMYKKGLGVGTIKFAMIALIFVAVFLALLPNLMHTAQVGVSNVATEFGNTTLYGDGPSAIGTEVDTYTGYFWVVGVIVFLIAVVLGIFMNRRR